MNCTTVERSSYLSCFKSVYLISVCLQLIFKEFVLNSFLYFGYWRYINQSNSETSVALKYNL